MASYKQPRRINAVSITLLVLLAAAGYLGFSAWPVIALDADVKSLLGDALPGLYRANLLPEPESSIGADEIRRSLIGRLGALGVPAPEAALTFSRDARTVAISARLAATIDLKLVHRRIPFTLNPRVATSAERVAY